MDFSQNGYCRLCATLLPQNKLINLLSDGEKRENIVTKLARLNASVDWSRADMPETICSACSDSLESAYCFLNSVEIAQNFFMNNLGATIIKIKEQKISIKTEAQSSSSGDEDFTCPSEDISRDIKQEIQEVKAPSKKKAIKKEVVKKKVQQKKASISEPKMTWRDYVWTCAACGSLFPSFHELQAHSLEVHNCCNKYRCTDCKKKRVQLNKFLRHVETHRKYLKLSCFKCFAEFPAPHDCRKHRKLHLNDDYECRGCNETFPTAEERDAHENIFFQTSQSYPATEKNYICSICNRGYINKGSLTAHLEKHSEKKNEQTCDKCGKNFSSRHNLLTHLKLHENTRPFQCKMCKLSFITHRKLRDHVECVHMNKKPFTCDKCGRSFRLNRQLKNHSIIHTDEMPFPCTFCDRSFRFKALLTQHIRQHTGVKPYSCVTCQHDFTNWGNYNKHMKRRHGIDLCKRKRTPNGVLPVNPATGEIITCDETSEILEWKRQVTTRVRKRQSRTAVSTEVDVKPLDINVGQGIQVDVEGMNVERDINVEQTLNVERNMHVEQALNVQQALNVEHHMDMQQNS